MSKLSWSNQTIKRQLLKKRILFKQRAILCLILAVIGLAISWLIFVKVEPVVFLLGELQPIETVERIELPQDSVIEEIYVQPGEQVQQGQELLSFDVANSFPKLKKLDDLEKSLKKENKFLQDVSNSWINNDQIEGDFDDINLSPQKIILVKNIISLLKENQTIQKKIFEDKAKLLLKIRQGEDHESDIADEIKSQQKAIIYQQKYLISIEEKLSELQTRIKVIISENENFINQIEKKKEKYQKFKKNIFLNSPISGQVKEINIQNKRLEILPDKKLIAYLFIAYQDQKLIHKNMKLKVMVNNSEQNNNFLLTGQIILIGSDILPPNDAYPFYHLPVQISLETEEMTTKEQEIFLKPGIPVKVELPSPQKKSLLEVLYRNVLW